MSVPASRAEIFKDTHLPPAHKRTLMRFLKNAMDALQDRGALKVSITSDIESYLRDWN